jgi:hypothetical protein
VAHEYSTNTEQLETLPLAYPQVNLAGFPHAAFDGASEISVVCLALDPEVFGVNANWHCLRPECGEVFLHKPSFGAVRLSSMR